MRFEAPHNAKPVLRACFIAFALGLPIAAQAGPREDLSSLNVQALTYFDKGDFGKSAETFERAVKLAERVLRRDDVVTGQLLDNLSRTYVRLGRYAEAEGAAKRTLSIYKGKLPPDNPILMRNLNGLAEIYRYEGRYPEAEAGHKELLARREKSLGPDHSDVAESLNNLAAVYVAENHYAEAEALLKRAITIKEKNFGPDHELVASSVANLASIYLYQARFAEAEQLDKRVIAIYEKVLGPDHPRVAVALNNLASLYNQQYRTLEAEPLLKRALAINEKAFGTDHPDIANNLRSLAELYRRLDRYADAEPLAQRAVALNTKILGPDHPNLATSLTLLAQVYFAQNRPTEAEPLLQRALAIREKALGRDHPQIALNLSWLAEVYGRQARDAEALDAARRAVAILVHDLQTAGDRSVGAASERRSQRDYFVQLIGFLARLSVNGTSPSQDIVEEAFRAAQYAGGIDTAKALAGMTARYAAGSDALAALVRERQDIAIRWRKLDADLVKAVSQPPEKRNADAEAALRREEVEVEAKLRADDTRLRRDFPRFAELAAGQPVHVGEIQSLLDGDEAFVEWMLADRESYVFVIRRDLAHFFRLDITQARATEMVRSLRSGLTDDGAQFDVAKAYELYKSLIGPAESIIADARRLIVVPDGALESLPPSVLVTTPPKAEIQKTSDYKSVDWLIRRQAVTILPAASSFVALRRLAEVRRASEPFIGFGDPDFSGEGSARGARGIKIAQLYRGGEADLANLRRLPRLAESAGELRAEAKALGAPDASVHLGPEASVTFVKRADLSNTRIVAFATHGLIAGDLPELGEPALALSPPAKRSADDDGLLRASQISQLKLGADFVILSACNTAASDGTPGAEGLSGLAKAFFYAGARSLLVSHWEVESDAAVKLTTGLIRATADDPAIGRAEALRRSILAMIDGAAEASYAAHPSRWGPFVLAGEGGAKR